MSAPGAEPETAAGSAPPACEAPSAAGGSSSKRPHAGRFDEHPHALDGAVLALTFLTVIPVRARGQHTGLGAAAAWFPLVGALVGGIAGATRYFAEPLFGAAVASVLALVVFVAVTGALHEDGLADCADGLGVRGDRERRLVVMRDSAIGAFGTLALVGWALALTTALATLSGGEALRALASAAIVGRWAALIHAAATPPARRDGLGATFAVSRPALALATALTIAGAVAIDGPLYGVGAAAAGLLVALAMAAWARRALGGRTGDTLGASVALAEVAVCLTLLAFASP